MAPAPPPQPVSLARPARRRYPWPAPATRPVGSCRVELSLDELRVMVESLRQYLAPTLYDQDTAQALVLDLAGYVADRYESMGVAWR